MTALDALLDALASSDTGTRVTSVRRSRALDAAVSPAVELGWAPNANEGLNSLLRASLESFARDLALEEHLQEHPHLRPTLAELTIAMAEIDHNPLADEPELISRAAEEIVAVKPAADPDDVLVWALSRLLSGTGSSVRRL